MFLGISFVGGGLDHEHVGLVLVVVLYHSVGDLRGSSQELVLKLFVVLGNKLSLGVGDGQESRFLLSSHSLELLESLLDLVLDHGKNLIIGVDHLSGSDSVKSRSETGSLDFCLVSWIFDILEHLV
jgi:hypothetical protein